MGSINISFITFLLQGIPEQSAVTTLAFVIAKLPLKWSRILLIGTVLALCAFVVRQFPIPFGIHTILLIFILFMFLTRLVKGDFSISLIASLISFLALIIFEMVSFSLLMLAFGVTTTTLLTDSVVRILMALPQVVLLFLTAFLLKKYLRRGPIQ